MREPFQWQEDDLHELISSRHEESIELDFKSSGALSRDESNKTEISKDVSAFANSIGGTILYGMDESKDSPHCAFQLTPIDPQQISKEWLEQIINSRIHPHIAGLLINPIELRNSTPGKFAYVVVIPESITAHQAFDKRYYKRFNFESVPMEDYEIRQTMNRASRPAYKAELIAVRNAESPDGRPLFSPIHVIVENQSEIVGHDVSSILFAPSNLLEAPDSANLTVWRGIQYTRIPGVYIPSSNSPQLSAVPAAHPFTRYCMTFQKKCWLRNEMPTTLLLMVFDRFGVSLTAEFRILPWSPQPVLVKEIQGFRRGAGTLAISDLE